MASIMQQLACTRKFTACHATQSMPRHTRNDSFCTAWILTHFATVEAICSNRNRQSCATHKQSNKSASTNCQMHQLAKVKHESQWFATKNAVLHVLNRVRTHTYTRMHARTQTHPNNTAHNVCFSTDHNFEKRRYLGARAKHG